MINKKIIIAAGTILLSAATMIVCSCALGQLPISATAYSPDTSDCDSENAAQGGGFENISSENTPEGDFHDDEYSSDVAPEIDYTIPGSTKIYFDDPESYLQYDEEIGTYLLSEEEEKLGEESLFVGDSICNGFAWCSVLRGKNVYATPSVAAHNMLTFDMTYRGEPAKFIPVLKQANPKHIFFWMGMNDVNLTTAEQYCENYRKIIDVALAKSDADVYVCAITPIRDPDFTKPEYINEFNDAIKRFIRKNYKDNVHFIDFGGALKNAEGVLDEQYDGGDGIHLSYKSYYVAMHEINKQVVSK